jgi:hypothetical protein
MSFIRTFSLLRPDPAGHLHVGLLGNVVDARGLHSTSHARCDVRKWLSRIAPIPKVLGEACNIHIRSILNESTTLLSGLHVEGGFLFVRLSVRVTVCK